jgi:predicted adenine nucleotide alpha hydrolase (AANH) superfamily ATPase
VPRLREEGHDVTMFYSNSNIDTEAEFNRRLEAASALSAADGVDFV